MSNDTDRDNWLVFGAGSPESIYKGTKFNIGAAVVDLLARKDGAALVEAGPLQTNLIEIGGCSVRLAKPNLVPEMIDDAIDLMKKRFLARPNTTVIVYGDPDFAPGLVKIMDDCGSNGNLVVSKFLKAFDGAKNSGVYRVRVGVGRRAKGRYGERSDEIEDDEGADIWSAVQNAALAIRILVARGERMAKQFLNLANKNQGHLWIPKN